MLTKLPQELLQLVLQFCIIVPGECAKVERTCKQFYSAVNSPEFFRNNWAWLIYRAATVSSTTLSANTFDTFLQAQLDDFIAAALADKTKKKKITNKTPIPNLLRLVARYWYENSFRLVSQSEAVAHYSKTHQHDISHKIIIYGPEKTGKSAFVHMFFTSKFVCFVLVDNDV